MTSLASSSEKSVAINVDQLSFRYGQRAALNALNLQVDAGLLFGLLGPNGSGKTTLFRILSTLLPIQSGSVSILGVDVATQPQQIRHLIGVTFQSPSLDGKLTVYENLLHQSRLYGLSRETGKKRISESLSQLGLHSRGNDLVETLSGGLKRRTEIAKSLLHRPELLLLDEPSTGLDPAARIDLWRFLQQIRHDGQTTIVLSTHLMDEADRCDHLALLAQGELIAQGRPRDLKHDLGERYLSIQAADLDEMAHLLRSELSLDVQILPDQLRIDHPDPENLLTVIMERYRDLVLQITLGRPTLEDVFIQKTGHQFWGSPADEFSKG